MFSGRYFLLTISFMASLIIINSRLAGSCRSLIVRYRLIFDTFLWWGSSKYCTNSYCSGFF